MTRFTLQPPDTEHTPPATAPPPGRGPRPMTRPFPAPGPTLQYAYEELGLAAAGRTPTSPRPDGLARPWDPPTCTDPTLRGELWEWLEAVADWINTEYTWDAAAMIPPCWPDHPHLVHELAVLADQRHHAGLAHTSTPLEEWHRYSLPGFTARMTDRIRAHCTETHQPWPGQPRHQRAADHHHDRARRFTEDQKHQQHQPDPDPEWDWDRETGEILGPR